MKILRNGKIYIDKNDLTYFERVPNFIFHEFDNYFNYDKFMVFSNSEAINYFLDSFIINYDDVKKLTNDELKKKIEDLKKRLYLMKFNWLKSNYDVKKNLSLNIKRRAITKYLKYLLETLIYYKDNREYYDNIVNYYLKVKTLRM